MRHINGVAAIYLASRNLAILEREGFKSLLVPCNGCHLSFRETMHYLNDNEEGKGKNARILQNEDLEYKGDLRIYHVIDFLYDFIGINELKKKVVKSLAGLTLASHTGCHIIRPSDIGGLADDSEKPQKLDRLIQTLGAKTVDYPEKLDCCGSGLLLSHGETTLTLAGLKTRALQEREVDGLIDSCPACHMMFDARQEACGATIGKDISLPVLYYSQLLGIAMGIENEKLGLHLNQSPIERLLEKID
jgi:heterodisulfide reductase subunit B